METPSISTEDFARLLHVTAHDWRTALDRRLRPLGLSRATWMVLAYVRQLGGPNQTALAEQLGLEGASVVRLIDRLEREQLVERRIGIDRRAKTIHLTPKGEEITAEIWRVAGGLRNELMHDIPSQEVERSMQLLSRLQQRLARLS